MNESTVVIYTVQPDICNKQPLSFNIYHHNRMLQFRNQILFSIHLTDKILSHIF